MSSMFTPIASDVYTANTLNTVPTLKLSQISKVGGSGAAYPYAGAGGTLVHYNAINPVKQTTANVGGASQTYPYPSTGAGTNLVDFNTASTGSQIAAAPKPTPTTQATAPDTLTAPAAPQGPQWTQDQKDQFMRTLLMSDPTLKGEIGAGQSALGEQWTGSVLTPIVQALTNYGAPLPSDLMTQLNAINAPTIYDPYSDSQIPVGSSLGAYLQNPDISAAIATGASNPYSTFNLAKLTADLEGGMGVGSSLSRGLGHSSAIGNALARATQDKAASLYASAQAIMNQLTGNISGFGNNINTWLGQQSQYINDTMNTLANEIANGLIALPSNPTSTPTNPTGAYAGPDPTAGTGSPPYAIFPSSGPEGNIAGVPVDEGGQIVAEPTGGLGAQGWIGVTNANAAPTPTPPTMQQVLAQAYGGGRTSGQVLRNK